MNHLAKAQFFLIIILFPALSSAQTANELNKSGIIKAKAGDFAGAIADYDRAIHLDSTKAEIFFNRATSKAKSKNQQGAIVDYSKSIVLKSDPDSYYARALMEIEISDYKVALDDLNKSYEAKKNNPNYFFMRGDCKYLLKKISSAIDDFTKAIELKPDYDKAYFFRGICEISMNKKEDGCKDLGKAKELNYSKASEFISKYCN